MGSRPTDQERQTQRTEALARLEHATETLLTSDGWRGWLRTRATLHRYSANNTLLIRAQALERGFQPSHVAGFKAWLRLGRCVRKGEKGLKVFAPMPIRKRADDQEEKTTDSTADEQRPRVRFTLSTVFDVSQTDPLPDVEPAPLRPPRQPLQGDSHAAALEPLCAFAASINYPVSWANEICGDGVCNHTTKQIKLRAGMAPNHQVSTLIHELCHAMIGPQSGLERNHEEVIVEATTYIAAAAAGLDSSTDSVPYIAAWGGEDPLATVRQAIALIDTLANRLQPVLADTAAQAPQTSESPLQAA